MTSGLTNPSRIALDVSAAKMYLAGPTDGKIQRANLDGSGLEDVASGCSPASLRPIPVRKLALVAELCHFLSCLCPPSDGFARWFRGQGELASRVRFLPGPPSCRSG